MTRSERRKAKWLDGECRECPLPREADSVFCHGHREADRERARSYKRERADGARRSA